MTRAQAITRLRKLFGEKLFYRVGQAVSSPESRAAALAQHRDLQTQSQSIDAEIKRRLAETPWYQELLAQRRALVEAKRKLPVIPYFKFQVGHSLGWANVIDGEGDTWEQAIEQAEKKKAADAAGVTGRRVGPDPAKV